MESLTTWGFISPVTPAKLEKLVEYYQANYVTKGVHLSKKIAEKLVNLLLSLTDEVDRSSLLRQHPTQNAKTALQLIYFWLLSGGIFDFHLFIFFFF